jgi:hypothetical protein
MRLVALAPSAILAALLTFSLTCDDTAHPDAHPPATTSAAAVASTASTPPEVRAPDIIVEPGYVSIGTDRVLGGDQGLADKVAIFLTGRPMIEGRTIDVVAMRNARPSQVAAVVLALRRAKATGAFDSAFAPCTTIAWIAKDAAIDVWPAGGGTAKRIIKGLAGPDMTLGTEAVSGVGGRCDSSDLVIGADDAMTWGLVFDLATMALRAPEARASKAVLVTSAVPGRRLVMD